jgi:3'-phosphoadenosine 5'-phosphosulfate sulfotransferase (PAPS reductase)/FAD synthetase
MRVLALSGGKDSMACLFLTKGTFDWAIYVNTGKAYPETIAMIRYASRLVPVVIVDTDQAGQNRRVGLPAEIVPVDWTLAGQMITGTKPVMVQSYLGCCYENISHPLFMKAKQLGATEMIHGQRNDEGHKSPARDGDVVEGVKRIHPIENWTSERVLSYLAQKMIVPDHYKIKHSSLDCYDCTAFRKDSHDRLKFTKQRHPGFYDEYAARRDQLNTALDAAMDIGETQ